MVNLKHMINIEDLTAIHDERLLGLADMASEAVHFLKWHHWCHRIVHGYLDQGWAGILAVFYFDIEVASVAADNALWVIVGDIPPAYIDTFSCPIGKDALEAYVQAMQNWVDCAIAKQSLDEIIPVYERYSFAPVSPTPEHAQMLKGRLEFIKTRLLPIYT